jgi:hypothetical protein
MLMSATQCIVQQPGYVLRCVCGGCVSSMSIEHCRQGDCLVWCYCTFTSSHAVLRVQGCKHMPVLHARLAPRGL